MSSASILLAQDQFICSVCLDLLKDPVTILCGHSFCKVCINGCWDQDDEKGVYCCPQCRDTFTPRPVLRRNEMLAQVVEKLKIEVPDESVYAGPGDVECDFCTGKKFKAIKSCLVCVASFCESHLKPHYLSPAFKKHTLTEVSANLHKNICSDHGKVLEIYCRTDQTCICFLCTMDKHRGHNTITAAAERAQKQSSLKGEQVKFQQRIQERQKKVEEMKQTVNTIKSRTQRAVEECEMIFTTIITSMEKSRSEVTGLIRAQEKAEVSQAERLLRHLEQEIADFQGIVTELEKLSHTHDHVHFIQTLASGHLPSQHSRPDVHTSSITVNKNLSFDEVRNTLSYLKSRLEDLCKEELRKILPQSIQVRRTILTSAPEKREDFLEYFCDVTLDPNTAHRNLKLSDKNRVVRFTKNEQKYSDHPERFDCVTQVLCKNGVHGRSYWEVEWSGDGGVFISVSYKGIGRKGWGNECLFGRNGESWSLYCSASSLSFYHNNIKTVLRVPSTSRTGVYVDHSAGTLSFYSISDTMRLFHRVHTTFTQPLYPGFWVGVPSTVRLCEPK